MQLTKKQSFYLSLIHSAEHNKLSIREVAEQNNVNAVNLYAAIKTLREKGALPAAKEQRNFVKLSALPRPRLISAASHVAFAVLTS